MKVEKPPLYKAVIEVEVVFYHDQFKTLRTAEAVAEDITDCVDENMGPLFDVFDNVDSVVVSQARVTPYHKN